MMDTRDGVLALVLLALVLIAGWLGFDGWKANSRAEKAEAAVVTVQADLATCRANTATLDGKLTEQNAKVRQLETAIAAADKRAKELKTQADRENAKDDAVIAKLRRLQAGPDRCEAARKVLAEELR
jgi:predicted  nucleic acid-binding Zn-ribbon protein